VRERKVIGGPAPQEVTHRSTRSRSSWLTLRTIWAFRTPERGKGAMKPKVYIDGKEGTTGLQIYERLGGRDDLELLLIDEDKRKDVDERRKFLNASDIVF